MAAGQRGHLFGRHVKSQSSIERRGVRIGGRGGCFGMAIGHLDGRKPEREAGKATRRVSRVRRNLLRFTGRLAALGQRNGAFFWGGGFNALSEWGQSRMTKSNGLFYF